MPNPRSRLPSALLALGLLLGSFAAEAEESAAIAMARTRFQEGVEYFDAGRFEEARAAFLQAYALEPHPSILLNIAQSELKAGMYEDAAKRFTECLASSTNHDETQTNLAEQGLAEARRHVGELRITADVGHADVFVDGRRVGTTPVAAGIFVAPGRHTVLAQSGSATAEQEVTAEAAGVHSVELVLLPMRSQITLRRLPLGATLESGERAPPEERPAFPRWLFSSPVGIAGLVVTGAGVGLGITGSIVASDRYDAARDASDAIRATARAENLSGTVCSNGTSPLPRYRAACADRQDLLSQGDTWKGVALGGFVLAGAAAAGTVAYYFLDGAAARRESQTGRLPTVVPILSAEQQGLAVFGTF